MAEQFPFARICTAAEAPGRVPTGPGYYAIFIDRPTALPGPFSKLLVQRKTELIYIGIATRSLYSRLVKEDLQHRKPSTFFRGIGAILNYRPPLGSLLGRSNQNNYRFSPSDTSKIRGWIDQHLSVSWQEAQSALLEDEVSWIQMYSPILNTKHNPMPVQRLADLRLQCRTIAGTLPAGMDM